MNVDGWILNLCNVVRETQQKRSDSTIMKHADVTASMVIMRSLDGIGHTFGTLQPIDPNEGSADLSYTFEILLRFV